MKSKRLVFSGFKPAKSAEGRMTEAEVSIEEDLLSGMVPWFQRLYHLLNKSNKEFPYHPVKAAWRGSLVFAASEKMMYKIEKQGHKKYV